MLLALSVVLDHLGAPYALLGGPLAVEAFFVLSGFYMFLVLDRKYLDLPAGRYLFYTNRLLRLLVTYWIVLAVSILVFLALWQARIATTTFGPWIGAFGALDTASRAWLLLCQLSLFGLDTSNFLAVGPGGGLMFAPDFIHPSLPAFRLLFVPQAWSLSLELYFYLLAPFLARRSLAVLVTLVLLSVLARVLMFALFGWHRDPWSYRFFPGELVFFLLGGLACRAHASWQSRMTPRAARLASAVLLATTLLWPLLPLGRDSLAGRLPYLLLLAATLPWLFELSRDDPRDRALGELSYPLYLCHLLLIAAFDALLQSVPSLRAGGVVLASLALAWMLARFVEWPLERFRGRRLAQAGRPSGVAAPPTSA